MFCGDGEGGQVVVTVFLTDNSGVCWMQKRNGVWWGRVRGDGAGQETEALPAEGFEREEEPLESFKPSLESSLLIP